MTRKITVTMDRTTFTWAVVALREQVKDTQKRVESAFDADVQAALTRQGRRLEAALADLLSIETFK